MNDNIVNELLAAIRRHAADIYEPHRLAIAPRTAFALVEAERAKDHGSAAYALAASDCDQVRELQREQEERKLHERWKDYWVSIEGVPLTDSDMTGEECEPVRRRAEAERVRIATALANLSQPRDHESPSDYAARHKMNTAKQMGITYETWHERVVAEMHAVRMRIPVERGAT